jgi:hypothetical protein
MRPIALALLLLATPARADDAASLQAALRGWASQWSGGMLAAVPVEVHPEGNGLAITLPLPEGVEGLALTPPRVTAQIHRLDAAKWSIDSVAIPAQASFTANGTQTLFGLKSQQISGEFDPSLAAESYLDLHLKDYVVGISSSAGKQATRMATITSHNLMTPTGANRVAITNETEIQDYTQKGTGPDGSPVDLAVHRIRARSLFDDVSFRALGNSLRNLFAAADAPKGAKTKAQRALLHDALHAFIAASAGIEEQQDWEGIAFTASGQQGTIAHVGAGLALHAPNGMIEARLPLVLQGFSAPSAGDAALQALLPKSIKLTPRLSGLSKNALVKLLDRLLDSDDTPDITEEANRLLEDSKLRLALDDLAFDLGPMKVTGHGRLRVETADDIDGTAELRATGLDALVKRASAIPDLRQAVPVLIFLKGIAEADGNAAVWRITWKDGEVEVNDTPLADLGLPGSK